MYTYKDLASAFSWQHAALVTPNDAADLPPPVANGYWRAFSFVTAGDLKVTTIGGETLVIPAGALAVGTIYWGRIQRIWNTGTTAAGIVVYG